MKCVVFFAVNAIFCQIVSSTPHFWNHGRFHGHGGYNGGHHSSWYNPDNHGPAHHDDNKYTGSNRDHWDIYPHLQWPGSPNMDWRIPEGPGIALITTTTSRPPPTQTTQQISTCVSSCPVTAEYNPVCGSNNITYPNPGRLECEQDCGVVVNLTKNSACTMNERLIVENSTSPTTVELGSTISSIPSTSTSARPNINEIPDQTQLNNGNNGNNNGNNGIICEGANNSIKKKPPSVREVMECMQKCSLTSEYNPVCGTDNITYMNPGRLLCARFCGIDVEVTKFTSCSSNNIDNQVNHCVTTCTNPSVNVAANPESIAPTSTPSLESCMKSCPASSSSLPVCGTNNVTYSNLELLQCARGCGVDVELKFSSPCSMMLPTTPNPTTTPKPTLTTEMVPEVTSENIDPRKNATLKFEILKLWPEDTTTPEEEEFEINERRAL